MTIQNSKENAAKLPFAFGVDMSARLVKWHGDYVLVREEKDPNKVAWYKAVPPESAHGAMLLNGLDFKIAKTLAKVGLWELTMFNDGSCAWGRRLNEPAKKERKHALRSRK